MSLTLIKIESQTTWIQAMLFVQVLNSMGTLLLNTQWLNGQTQLTVTQMS